MSRRFGFTLVEMMLATVLAALLMAGVLTVVSGLSRDQRRMRAKLADERPGLAVELIRRDLGNAMAMIRSADGNGIVLVGHCGIDRGTLSASGRLAKVTYRMRGRGAGAALVREQEYLDDEVRRERWGEVVLAGVRGFEMAAGSNDGEVVRLGEDLAGRVGDGGRAIRVPGRMLVRFDVGGRVLSEEVVVR
jgi:prepilin-type N-terminal cleavage/methylation domain-containing protein